MPTNKLTYQQVSAQNKSNKAKGIHYKLIKDGKLAAIYLCVGNQVANTPLYSGTIEDVVPRTINDIERGGYIVGLSEIRSYIERYCNSYGKPQGGTNMKLWAVQYVEEGVYDEYFLTDMPDGEVISLVNLGKDRWAADVDADIADVSELEYINTALSEGSGTFQIVPLYSVVFY